MREKLRRYPVKHEGESCRTLATAAGVRNSTMHAGVEGRPGGKALQDAALPQAYGQSCGHEGLKTQGNPPGDSRRHAAELRVHGREEIRHPAGGKPAKQSRLGFLVIHREKDRFQTPNSALCHGLGGRHRDRELPSPTNQELWPNRRHHSDYLVALRWRIFILVQSQF